MRAKILSLILCSLFMLNACSDDELVVATAANFMPFEYVEGKEFRGIDMDIAKVIADKLHKKLVIKDMEFDSVVTALASHNADIAISGLTINQTRAKVIDFSNTYFNASQMVIIESSDERFAHIHDKEQLLETLRTIPNLKIGVQAGTTAQFYVTGDKDWGFEGLANAEVKGFSNGALATIAMKNHQVDIVMIDEMPARAIVAANEGVSLLEIPLTNEQYAIGVAKGENELKNQINAILQSMKDDGTMENIIKKHYAQGAN